MRHLSFSAPAILAKGRVAAAASALVVGAVLLTSCSSGPSAEDQINEATHTLMDATNSGNGTTAREILCQAALDQNLADQFGEPVAVPRKIDKIEDIKIDGDNATAKVTISADDLDAPLTDSLKYVNEDGWKVCI